MSKFLGPVHYMLFSKIVFQDNFCMFLANKASEQDEMFIKDVEMNTFIIPNLDLSDMVDLNNIHGSLQDLIGEIEYKLVYVVNEIENRGIFTFDEILNMAKSYGNMIGKRDIGGKLTLQDAYTFINSKLLNGMPCDKVQEVLENTETEIVWADKVDIHEVFWSNFDRNGKDFYKIRGNIIEGILENTNIHFEERKDFEYVLRINRNDGIGISVLLNEHDNILKFIEIVNRFSIEIMNGKEVDIKKFREFIDFARNYADKHHHGKEELILFRIMVEELGGAAEKLVKHGMLVEHDLGRLYIMTLEEALNNYENSPSDESKVQIIANSIEYGNHLKRHIDKENNAVYTFAQRHLSTSLLEKVDDETIDFENKEFDRREYYENWLNSF